MQQVTAPSMKRFALVYVATIIACIALTVIFDYFLHVDISNSAMGIIPAMAAASDAGSQFAMKNNATPEPKYSWWVSRKTLLVELLITVPFAAVFLLLAIGLFPSLSRQTLMFALIVGIVIHMLIAFLCNRFFFSLGAKNEIKRQEKRSQ